VQICSLSAIQKLTIFIVSLNVTLIEITDYYASLTWLKPCSMLKLLSFVFPKKHLQYTCMHKVVCR